MVKGCIGNAVEYMVNSAIFRPLPPQAFVLFVFLYFLNERQSIL